MRGSIGPSFHLASEGALDHLRDGEAWEMCAEHVHSWAAGGSFDSVAPNCRGQESPVCTPGAGTHCHPADPELQWHQTRHTLRAATKVPAMPGQPSPALCLSFSTCQRRSLHWRLDRPWADSSWKQTLQTQERTILNTGDRVSGNARALAREVTS